MGRMGKKVMMMFIILCLCFSQHCTQKPEENMSVNSYKVEISFDSVLHYLRDTSIAAGMVCLHATTKNLTADTISLKISEKGCFSGFNYNIIAKYDSLIIPVEICSNEGLLWVFPNETTFDLYYYTVDFSDFGIDYYSKHKKYFVFSPRFYKTFFDNCTFHLLQDSSSKIILLKNPKFKIMDLKNTKIEGMPCSPV